MLNGLESAAWSLYKHQGILTIDLGRLGVVFGTVIGERRKRTKKGGDKRKSVRSRNFLKRISQKGDKSMRELTPCAASGVSKASWNGLHLKKK